MVGTMLKIGLTGGIGSGKSTVADCFATRGIEIIDADVIARELVTPPNPALAEIVAAFGAQYLNADGHLDRARLRAHIFADPQARKRLERILHPRIGALLAERAAGAKGPYCVLVIPLLLETGQRTLVDRILVVDVPVDLQVARVAARDGLDHEQIHAILAVQTDREARLAQADDIIVNDCSRAALQEQVAVLDARYRALATSNS